MSQKEIQKYIESKMWKTQFSPYADVIKRIYSNYMHIYIKVKR